MNNILRNIAIWLTVIFSLMGCTLRQADKGFPPPSIIDANPAQAQNNHDVHYQAQKEMINCAEIFQVSNRVATDKARTIHEAANLGAFIGEIISIFISRDDYKRGIGHILGGLVGSLVGNWVVMRKQRYANIENAINHKTQIITCQNESLRVENQKLKQDIKGYKQQIVALKMKANKPSLQAQKKAVKFRHQEAKVLLVVVKESLKEVKKQYNDHTVAYANKLKTWKTQVANLETEAKILQSHVDTLSSMIEGL
ncbi:MAG: hypothetical protein ABFS56_12855 [Pseudomonadota bacterium]